MSDLIVSKALLPQGWAERVRISVDAAGRIGAVEPNATPRDGDERVGGVALPGLADLHSHAFQRAMAGLTEKRGGAATDTFWTWREEMYRFLARLAPEDVEAVAEQLYVEMLLAGYTAVGEFHYLHHAPDGTPYANPAEMSLRLTAAAERSGIALTLLPTVYMTGDFGGAPAAPGQRRFLIDPAGAWELLESLRSEVRTGAGGGLQRLGLALHSLRAVPPDAIADALAGLAGAPAETPVHIHVAEQRREVEACLAWSGARPVEWLLDHAPVGAGWCLVHATHTTEEEARRIADSGAVAGLCPSTEGSLGDGFFPLRTFRGAGGVLGVGSDSHVTVSPVEEMRWMEYVQRLRTETRNVASGPVHDSTGRSLFEDVLRGGTRALALGNGALAAGLRADVVVLDPEHPILAGRSGDDLLDSWIFSGNRPAVRDVMVGGRWVVRDGRHLREDVTLTAYRDAIRRLG